MALSVLTEVGRLLEKLAETGRPGAIDLRSLPLSDADRRQLEELLGHGEVRAELDLAGATEVWETAYPGAWWIRHFGAGGRIATEEIAVCIVPEILCAHGDDVRAAAQRINRDLADGPALQSSPADEHPTETSHV
jgi:hydrogenase-1 operon protein HyaF